MFKNMFIFIYNCLSNCYSKGIHADFLTPIAESSTSPVENMSLSCTDSLRMEMFETVLNEFKSALHHNSVLLSTKCNVLLYKSRMPSNSYCLNLDNDMFIVVFKICLCVMNNLFIHIPYAYRKGDDKDQSQTGWFKSFELALYLMQFFSPTSKKINGSEKTVIRDMLKGCCSRLNQNFFYGHYHYRLPTDKFQASTFSFFKDIINDDNFPDEYLSLIYKNAEWIEDYMRKYEDI